VTPDSSAIADGEISASEVWRIGKITQDSLYDGERLALFGTLDATGVLRPKSGPHQRGDRHTGCTQALGHARFFFTETHVESHLSIV
jgi:hypothetical protein